MAVSIEPEVLSVKQAWELCGGRPVWEDLREAYPELLKPFRRTGNREQFLRETIMQALRAAQMDGKLAES